MKLVTKSIIAVATILASSAANAAVVRCTDAAVKKNAPVILEYSYANTKSARLTSDILVEGQLVGSNQVAQYKTSELDLALVLDDDITASVAILRMAAIRISTNQFLGAMARYSNSGALIKNRAVLCKISAN